MKKVLVFGSFDLLHLGHIYFLKKAKKLGDYLIVCLTRDKIYKLQKKRVPLFNEKQRKKLLESLKFVDKVILGDSDLKKIADYNIIKKIKPDIVALGYDQKVDKKILAEISKKLKKKVKVVRVSPFQSKIFNSTRFKSMESMDVPLQNLRSGTS